jgi:hypothetical protein
MTGSIVAPFVIVPMAFFLLAVWIGMVYWADLHPAHKEHSAHKGYGATPNPDATSAREDAPAHGEHEGGEQASRPNRRAA